MAWELVSHGRTPLVAVLALALVTTGLAPTAGATSQDDAGSGGDAGDSFEDATAIDPPVPYRYGAELDAPSGDTDDFYKFHLEEGDEVLVALHGPEEGNLTAEMLDPEGRVLDVAVQQRNPGPAIFFRESLRMGLTHPVTGFPFASFFRVSVAEAPMDGDYRLHVESHEDEAFGYEMCFRPCEGPRDGPVWVDPPQYYPQNIRVLLIPPAHGDLGDPTGPTAQEYVATTVQAIRTWEVAIDQFVADYPEFDYLQEISVTIDVFDGETPSAVGYDTVVAYIETGGPIFRGAAVSGGFQPLLPYEEVGLEGKVHDAFVSSQVILSLFGTAPRAGQATADYPELSDLYTTTLHEFGHVFGLGHTVTWTVEHGPDLLNSPAPFRYGNGNPLGDGGERSPRKCPSSLDLYALAQLYDWIPSGDYPEGEFDGFGEPRIDSPLEYELYCDRADPWTPTELVPYSA